MKRSSNDEMIIETRELPIHSFCVICDKPIYLDEEYEEVTYFDNPSKKRINKKQMVTGYAHKSCAIEKRRELEELKAKVKKQNRLALIISIISGAVVALLTMIIWLMAKPSNVALAIVIPWIIGYVITSELFVILSDNELGGLYIRLFLKIIKLPIRFWGIESEQKWLMVLKIILLILLVPFGLSILGILIAISMLISIIAFPVILIKSR